MNGHCSRGQDLLYIVAAYKASTVQNNTLICVSVEIAEAHWWLLLRSALRATPNYWPPRYCSHASRAGAEALRLVHFSVRGGKQAQTQLTFCGGGMSWVTASGGLRA